MAVDYDLIMREAIQSARTADNDDRKNNVETYLDYYRYDDTAGKLSGKPAETSTSWSKRPKFLPNITRDIIDRVSRIYDRAPRRSLDGSNIPEQCVEAIEAQWSREFTLAADREKDRMSRLCGAVGERIVWNEEDECLEWQPFLPDSMDVVQDVDMPTKEAALILETTTPDTVNSTAIRISTIYTNEEIRRFEDDTEINWRDPSSRPNDADAVNPYGIIPVVIYKNAMTWREFWPVGWGGSLTDANERINELFCDLLHLCDMQTFSVPVFTNCQLDDPNRGVGPASPMSVKTLGGEPNSGFHFETPKADFPGVLAVLNAIMDVTYQTHGLSNSPMRIQTLPSGIALAIQRVDLLDDWRARQNIWTEFERDRAWKSAVVWCVANKQKPPARSDIVLKLDWMEPRLPIDPDASAREYAFQLSNDLISRARILQDMNPEMTMDEAMELASDIAEENRADRAGRAPTEGGQAVTEATAAMGSFLASYKPGGESEQEQQAQQAPEKLVLQ